MKNKGIWIVIVLILVCGVAVTSYTSRMVGQSGMSAGQTSRSMASSGAAAYGAALAGGGAAVGDCGAASCLRRGRNGGRRTGRHSGRGRSRF